MISPVAQNDNLIKTSIFYINDFHGKMSNFERVYTASKAFDSFETSADKLKLSSGDDSLGEDCNNARAVGKLLDLIGITKRQNGNHEYDLAPKYHAEIAKSSNYKELGGINIHTKPNSVLNGTMISSAIEEHNGNKYGIVGIGPSDMRLRLKDGGSKDEIEVDDENTTIVNLQKEVDKLRSQGVNKIILLSHSGYENEKRIAQQTRGIDVILGGHSHDLIKDVTPGKNLFYNADGEPVVITQAGKDGEHFGVLNLEFNQDGIIKKVQNNVMESSVFNRTLPIKYTVEGYIGRPEHIGTIKSAPPAPKNRLIENNPHGNFICDAMRKELGTDITLVNTANMRGYFEKGEINSRMVTEISPFKNKTVVASINEKELVDAIKHGGSSFNNPGGKPGIVMVSGLRYIMSDKGQLLKLERVDDNGKVIKNIDVNNPDVNTKYRVAMDDFFAKGGDNYTMLKKFDIAEKVYDFDKDKLTCDYIKHLGGNVEITDDKRIQIVKA